MSLYPDSGFPRGTPEEPELLLRWLRYLRGAVIGKVEGLTEEQSRWRPDGALISLLGIVTHLTNVEWRWIDGGMLGQETSRSDAEFHPGAELTVDAVLTSYVERADSTEAAVRRMPLDQPCLTVEGDDMRWVLLHLINATARHAGHAVGRRERLEGVPGE